MVDKLTYSAAAKLLSSSEPSGMSASSFIVGLAMLNWAEQSSEIGRADVICA
jgi:hypothetical protein